MFFGGGCAGAFFMYFGGGYLQPIRIIILIT